MAQSGTEFFIATGGTKMQFMIHKENELKRVQDELTVQGKEIVNILEGEIKRPLSGWWQEIRVIWKTTDVKPIHTVTTPQAKPTTEKVSVTSDNFNSILERIDLFLEDKNWEKAIAYCESALDFDPKNANIYLKYLLADCKCSTFEELLSSNKPFDKNSNYQKALRFGDEEFTSSLKETILRDKEQKEIIRCNNIYDQAKSLISNTNQTEESYDSICKLLKSIPGYKDADELLEIHTIKAEEYKRENTYNKAIKASKSNHIDELKSAIALFNNIKNFKDSNEQILFCHSRISELETIAEKERQKQEEKERLAREQEQQEKSRKNKKRKIIAISVLSVIALIAAIVFLLVTVVIPNNKYSEAIDLMNNGQFEEAISIFESLDGFKDSNNKFNECLVSFYGEDVLSKVQSISIGSTYTFGTYEQDNVNSNGSEEIEWVVLAKKHNKVLVISKYCLDCKPYSSNQNQVEWVDATLRRWLNEDFYNIAFSDLEKKRIAFNKSSNNVNDKIFLLSQAESDEYFSSYDAKMCVPTEFAIAQGCEQSSWATVNGKPTAYWWLKKTDEGAIPVVWTDGTYSFCEYYGDEIGCPAVRPAMWIIIE